jgi:hypothetical protein
MIEIDLLTQPALDEGDMVLAAIQDSRLVEVRLSREAFSFLARVFETEILPDGRGFLHTEASLYVSRLVERALNSKYTGQARAVMWIEREDLSVH